LALLPVLFAKGMGDRIRWDNPQRFSLR